MTKKLTLAELNKLGKKFNEKKKIYILNNEYEVDIDVKFRPSDIDDLVLVYVAAIEELRTLNKADDIQIKDTVSLLPTLILRSFTNLPIPKKNTDIASLIVISKNLYNEGIIEEVYSHFPESEINKVNEKINAFGKNIGVAIGELAVQSALQDNKGEENAELQQSE